jgi:hypothetical protein
MLFNTHQRNQIGLYSCLHNFYCSPILLCFQPYKKLKTGTNTIEHTYTVVNKLEELKGEVVDVENRRKRLRNNARCPLFKSL